MAGIVLVRDVMTKAVKTARTDDTVIEAVQKMNKFGIGSIVVMEGEKAVGIVTGTDVLRRIVEPCTDPTLVKVREIMSSPLVSVSPEASIEEAAKLMANKKIKKLPVIEKGKLTGIVTSMDLMRAGPELISLLEELLKARYFPPELK